MYPSNGKTTATARLKHSMEQSSHSWENNRFIRSLAHWQMKLPVLIASYMPFLTAVWIHLPPFLLLLETVICHQLCQTTQPITSTCSGKFSWSLLVNSVIALKKGLDDTWRKRSHTPTSLHQEHSQSLRQCFMHCRTVSQKRISSITNFSYQSRMDASVNLLE